MTVLRFLGTAAAVGTAALALAAYRRSEESGSPFGVCLRDVAGEWSPSALRERVRLAADDGSRAMALRERAAERQMAAADAAAS